MKLFDSRIDIPVGGYPLQITITSPRKPTVFERIIVFIVDRYNQSEIAQSSLKEIFADVLGLTDVDVFLDQALDELTSASVNVLTLQDYSVPPRDLPIHEIELTDEEGRQLVETGQLPGFRRQIKRQLFYDYINQVITEKREARIKNHPGFPAIPFESFTNKSTMIPRDVFSDYLQGTMNNDVSIHDFTCDEIQSFFKTVSVMVEATDGNLLFKCSEYPETETYLSNIPVDLLHDLFFSRLFDVPTLSNRLHKFVPEKFLSVQTPHDFAKSFPSSSDFLIYNHNDDVRKKITTTINIVCYEGAEKTVIFEHETKEALVVIDYELPWEPNAFSDFNTVWEISRFQFQYNGHLISLPLGVKYELPVEIKQTILQKAFSQICDSDDKAKYAFLIFAFSRDKAQREHICKMLRREEDINSILHDIESFFASPDRKIDMGTLIQDVFPYESLNTLQEIRTFLSVIAELSLAAKFREATKAEIVHIMDEMQVSTLDEWDKQTSILQMCDNHFADSHLEKLIKIAPKTSLGDLLEFAKESEEVLSKYKLISKFSFLLRQMLATVTDKEKKTLDEFVKFVDEVSDSNDELRKGLYCTADQFVLIPDSPDERIEFAKKCLQHSIPCPNNIFINDTAEYVIAMDLQGEPEITKSLNRINLLRPLLNLNAQRVLIAQKLKIASLSDYTELPSDINTKEVEILCREWLNNWTNACSFFDEQDNYCKNIIPFIQKILMDIQEFTKRINKKKYYVFDTSALIHRPDLLLCKNKNAVFIVPKIVLQELDGKKKDFTMQSEDSEKVRKAINYINKTNPQKEDSALDLLPEAYQSEPSNDDAILSVAIKYSLEGDEVFIVSDDINFSNKAIGEKISVLNAKKAISMLKKNTRKE